MRVKSQEKKNPLAYNKMRSSAVAAVWFGIIGGKRWLLYFEQDLPKK